MRRRNNNDSIFLGEKHKGKYRLILIQIQQIKNYHIFTLGCIICRSEKKILAQIPFTVQCTTDNGLNLPLVTMATQRD